MSHQSAVEQWFMNTRGALNKRWIDAGQILDKYQINLE